MYKVIRDVSGDDLEVRLNQVAEDHRGYHVDQVIPTLVFEQKKKIALISVPLPSEIKFNIILKQK